MLHTILSNFYTRDLRRLIEEVDQFTREDDLWKVQGTVKNSCGNLALHIIGGLNYLIGTQIGQTGYTRNRDSEFSARNIPKKDLIIQLENLIPMITETLQKLEGEKMEAPYPIPFDDQQTTISYVLVTLLAHLNYHLGQVNYLRRLMDL